MLSKIDEIVKERINGKHQDVKGEIIVQEDHSLRTIKKSFGPTINPPARFKEDVQDIKTIAETYQKFQEYQIQRDENFRKKAEELISC